MYIYSPKSHHNKSLGHTEAGPSSPRIALSFLYKTCANSPCILKYNYTCLRVFYTIYKYMSVSSPCIMKYNYTCLRVSYTIYKYMSVSSPCTVL
ncbi:hypothetical protein FKM82_021136 [Ascaphus truei]